jgi:hypothetical protein
MRLHNLTVSLIALSVACFTLGANAHEKAKVSAANQLTDNKYVLRRDRVYDRRHVERYGAGPNAVVVVPPPEVYVAPRVVEPRVYVAPRVVEPRVYGEPRRYR